MTAQASDKILYKNHSYSIIACTHMIPFVPEKYGLQPQIRCTACWRGYWCDYIIIDKQLYLHDLYIFNQNNNYPDFCGATVSPEEYDEYVIDGNYKRIPKHLGHRVYRDINLKIPYSGKLLGGNGLLQKYYIHMGFQRPYAYKKLYEFIFEKGILRDVLNHSDEALRMRSKINPDNGKCETKKDICNFISDSFSLDYQVKAWWLKQ